MASSSGVKLLVDGTNRNGGLISWASWANDSARLGKIERHYGRNISHISEREQLNYMKREMQSLTHEPISLHGPQCLLCRPALGGKPLLGIRS